MRTRKSLEERYWAKIDRRGPDECWPWTGGLGGSPYGLFWDGSYYEGTNHPRMVTATRVGYKLRVGPIPSGFLVCHTCDNPPCHNDRHWFLGTPSDNQRDCAEKGRNRAPKNQGSRHGRSKVTESQVDEIRKKYLSGRYLQKDLAEEYGILQQQVSRIVRGRSWSHMSTSSADSSASSAEKAASRAR